MSCSDGSEPAQPAGHAASTPPPLPLCFATTNHCPLTRVCSHSTSAEEKRQCNWCFQQLNCALAYKAERGEGGTADSFVRPSTDRGGNLDRIQQELAGKYERAAGHMTPAGEW